MEGDGAFRFSLMVYGSTPSTPLSAASGTFRSDLSPFIRSRFHLATSALKSEPSWNLTPWRSLTTTAVGLETSHDSASWPCTSLLPVAGSRSCQRKSESYRWISGPWLVVVRIGSCAQNLVHVNEK